MTRKKWIRPHLKPISLSDEELATVKAAADPIAELVKMKPELVRKKGER